MVLATNLTRSAVFGFVLGFIVCSLGADKVREYSPRDGTYVGRDYTTAIDPKLHNNRSTKKNLKPYTGHEATKAPSLQQATPKQTLPTTPYSPSGGRSAYAPSVAQPGSASLGANRSSTESTPGRVPHYDSKNPERTALHPHLGGVDANPHQQSRLSLTGKETRANAAPLPGASGQQADWNKIPSPKVTGSDTHTRARSSGRHGDLRYDVDTQPKLSPKATDVKTRIRQVPGPKDKPAGGSAQPPGQSDRPAK